MVCAMRPKSSFMMSTSAASMAMSVPAAPMAKPISACASAGASLMPSPVMAVTPYWLCRAKMACSLSSGSKLPRASSMPAWAATALAVAWLSPVSMTVRTPKSCSCASAVCELALMRSATANSASTWVSLASKLRVRPCASRLCNCASSAGLHRPRSCTRRWLPK